MVEYLCCMPKRLPKKLWIPAAQKARAINPVNHPQLHRLKSIMPGFAPTKQRIAVVTTKYWGPNGVRLTVGFLDNPPKDLRARILAHMNAWAPKVNVTFTESRSDPQVRIARIPGDGYWSYVGTDILSIEAEEPTMNLEGFTMQTAESEFRRVVRHEAGHTIGCPHEHMRKALVAKIDQKKAIKYFGETQGWTPAEVREQVLTPLEESSLLGSDVTDPNSIMSYQIPGKITKNGKPILGGNDIGKSDFDFMAKIYPVKAVPKPTKKKRAKRKSASRASSRSPHRGVKAKSRRRA
jgi:hypothetical protein